jgi:hypothetical protein
VSNPRAALRPRPKVAEGNDLLYHYLQKTLLEEDVEQFRLLTSRLIVALGVWLPPLAYERYPLLVPYAVRDPKCRGDRSRQLPDEWGTPDAAGQFRDDNSLVKGIPRSLEVQNPNNRLLHRKRLGTSFVASHVWRKLVDGRDAPRDRRTYSFGPNLVWLPSQLSKLSDREDSFVQTFLQAVSIKIYRSLHSDGALADIVEPIWAQLPVRELPAEIALPPIEQLNFFRFDEAWLSRRIRTLGIVVRALDLATLGAEIDTKVVARRYGNGLMKLAPSQVAALRFDLASYLRAVSVEPAPA